MRGLANTLDLLRQVLLALGEGQVLSRLVMQKATDAHGDAVIAALRCLDQERRPSILECTRDVH